MSFSSSFQSYMLNTHTHTNTWKAYEWTKWLSNDIVSYILGPLAIQFCQCVVWCRSVEEWQKKQSHNHINIERNRTRAYATTNRIFRFAKYIRYNKFEVFIVHRKSFRLYTHTHIHTPRRKKITNKTCSFWFARSLVDSFAVSLLLFFFRSFGFLTAHANPKFDLIHLESGHRYSTKK